MLKDMSGRNFCPHYCTTVLCLGVALLLGTATSVQAQGGPPQGEGSAPVAPAPVPDEVTVTVDCGAGDSINDALETPALQLTVLVNSIDGPCVENVIITRSNVILAGARDDGEPLDEIQGDPSNALGEEPSFGNVVTSLEVDNILIKDLIISEGTGRGIFVVGFGQRERVILRNLLIEGNKRGGGAGCPWPSIYI